MGWPQWTLIILTVLSLGITIAKHGEAKGGRYNFFASIAADAIVYTLLWFGGFFG